jgi:glycosyltransferase involved in cell wall biosynthesis
MVQRIERVLLVHNRYSSDTASGENAVVDDDTAALEARGITVEHVGAANDDVKHAGPRTKATAAASGLWSRRAARDIGEVIERFRPDVVHVHNLTPLLSASPLARALESGVPTVWSAHNYRLTCIAGSHVRNNGPCFDCRGRGRVPGIVHSCFSGSRAASTTVTVATSLQRRFVRDTTVVAISEHMRRYVIEQLSVPPEQVHVRPNSVPDPVSSSGPTTLPSTSTDVLLAARLTSEKGIALALDAWTIRRAPAGRLLVAGTGPLEGEVKSRAARDPSVVALGALSAHDVRALALQARAVLVVPTWDEPFGLVAVEGLAAGRPVVATDRGGLSEIIDDSVGRTVECDVGAVARALDWVLTADDEADRAGAAARERWADRYTPEGAVERLLTIYRAAQTRPRRPRPRSSPAATTS